MASKAVTAADTAETREEAAEAPLLDSIASAIKKMVARGKERGYLTYDELNAALPQDQVSSEQIEDTMTMLSELGINVIESEESEEPAEAEAEDGEAEARGNVDDDDIGRTDDPVRMYLREMGSVELLSREGEIAIAKRIEAGRDMMIGGICENPLTVRALLLWRDALNENKMLLRDIIDLDATYGSALVDEAEAEMAKVAAGAGEEGDAEGADGDGAEPPELEAEGEDGEGEESSISLSAMEAQLKPGMLAIFDAVAEAHKKIAKVQEQRITALVKGAELPRATERRYQKCKDEIVELLKQVRFNNTRIEHLVEQLYELNRRLVDRRGQAVARWPKTPGSSAPIFCSTTWATSWRATGWSGSPRCPAAAGPASASAATRSRSTAPRSRRSRWKRSCRSPSSAASCRPCSAASARRAAPRRRWSRPICGSSSRSRRNTPIAACNSST